MHQDTLRLVILAILDTDTREKMLEHLAKDSYEELKARVFKYLVHVKGIKYDEQKTWGNQLNQTEERSNSEGSQLSSAGDQDTEEWGAWSSAMETLAALMAFKGKGKGMRQFRRNIDQATWKAVDRAIRNLVPQMRNGKGGDGKGGHQGWVHQHPVYQKPWQPKGGKNDKGGKGGNGKGFNGKGGTKGKW